MNDNNQSLVEILMLETFESGKLIATIAQSVEGILVSVRKIDIEELAGLLCKGEIQICGFSSKSTLLKTFSKIAFSRYEVALFGKKLLICELDPKSNTTDSNGQTIERQYLVLDEVSKFDVMTKAEAEREIFLNAFERQDGEFYYSVGLRKVPELLFYSKGEATAISVRSKNLKEFISFKAKPFIKGRVIISNKLNPVLLNCHLEPTKAYIKIPKYVTEIERSGLTLREGFYRRIEFYRNTVIRPNSIFTTNGGIRIGILSMTCEQMADSRLSFLQDGRVTVKKLILNDEITEPQMRILIDVIRNLYSYISTDWLFEEEERPAVIDKIPILEVEWNCSNKSDYTELVYNLVAEVARNVMEQLDSLIAELDLNDDNPDVDNFTQYAETLINLNTRMIGTVYPELLGPFCQSDLITSQDYSLERLSQLFHEYLHGLLD